MPRLDLVVGPNGAGKSTFVELLLAPRRPNVPLVNADVIAAQRWPDDAEARAHDAARIAQQTRERLIDLQEPFIAETVFSHESKLGLVDLAQSKGFVVVLHVLLVPEELAVLRVAARVSSGGHSVPEERIRARYHRLWPLVAEAIHRCDVSSVWDNSLRDGPVQLGLFARGVLDGPCPWPKWAPPALAEAWPS